MFWLFFLRNIWINDTNFCYTPSTFHPIFCLKNVLTRLRDHSNFALGLCFSRGRRRSTTIFTFLFVLFCASMFFGGCRNVVGRWSRTLISPVSGRKTRKNFPVFQNLLALLCQSPVQPRAARGRLVPLGTSWLIVVNGWVEIRYRVLYWLNI
jgi:hypothetical protein